jgi:hypothetical protein
MSFNSQDTGLERATVAYAGGVSGAYFTGVKKGISFSALVSAIEDLTMVAKSKIAMIRSKRSSMSIADMFDLQMAMNRLSQLSDMSTSVIQAMNNSVSTMAKNVAR